MVLLGIGFFCLSSKTKLFFRYSPENSFITQDTPKLIFASCNKSSCAPSSIEGVSTCPNSIKTLSTYFLELDLLSNNIKGNFAISSCENTFSLYSLKSFPATYVVKIVI